MTNGAGGAALFDIVNVQNWTRRRTSGPFKQRSLPHRERRRDPFVNFQQAGLAHRAEHSPRKREAGGSSPPASTIEEHCTRGETADAAASEAAAAKAWRFKSSRVHQQLLASPSGQGIGPTHRHSQVRSPGASTIISPVAQRQSARPITGRPRIVTVRENQQQEINMTTTITKPGRLAAASPSPMDPERSSLRWLGNGLLIRAPRGSTPPGSSNRTITTHD